MGSKTSSLALDIRPAMVRSDVVAWLRARVPATHRPAEARQVLPSGIEAFDELLAGGWPRGKLSEVVGTGGRTALVVATAARITRSAGRVAWIDVADSLDPRSLEVAGVRLRRLLWVRPERGSPERGSSTRGSPERGSSTRDSPERGSSTRDSPERGSSTRDSRDSGVALALRATDWLAQAGGFELIVVDGAGGAPGTGRAHGTTHRGAGRQSWWVRLQRVVEASGAALVWLADPGWESPVAQLRLACRTLETQTAGGAARQHEVEVEIRRSRGGVAGGRARLVLARPLA